MLCCEVLCCVVLHCIYLAPTLAQPREVAAAALFALQGAAAAAVSVVAPICPLVEHLQMAMARAVAGGSVGWPHPIQPQDTRAAAGGQFTIPLQW